MTLDYFCELDCGGIYCWACLFKQIINNDYCKSIVSNYMCGTIFIAIRVSGFILP
jgi:hypothetical protein